MPLFKLLVALELAESGNDARRKVQGGGVTLGAERVKMTDPNAAVAVTDGLIVRSGKRMVRVQLDRGARAALVRNRARARRDHFSGSAGTWNTSPGLARRNT